jgi:hypothetical protein
MEKGWPDGYTLVADVSQPEGQIAQRDAVFEALDRWCVEHGINRNSVPNEALAVDVRYVGGGGKTAMRLWIRTDAFLGT